MTLDPVVLFERAATNAVDLAEQVRPDQRRVRLNGDFFASCDHRTGDLVVKLDEQAVSRLIDARRAEPFAPNGRRFREWASIPERQHRSWQSLLNEALALAAVRTAAAPGPTKRARRG